jgi:A/G-specific adenine glycosylase
LTNVKPSRRRRSAIKRGKEKTYVELTPSHASVRTFRRAILRWAREGGLRDLPWREEKATQYKKIVAEVLLQRTRAETVAAFLRGFVRRFPSWDALAEANEAELSEFLRPIGLWRRRSVSLRRLAKQMTTRKGRFPKTRKELEALPGVGQYIANAVLTICHRERRPLLDVNMARVLERYFGPRRLADIRHDPYLQDLAAQVVDHRDALLVNWALLDFAAQMCTARAPRCARCPLANECNFAQARS